MRVGRVWLLVVASMALLCGACGGDDDASRDGGTITVFAAASLTDAFTEVARAFEADNPGVEVRLNFAGSSALREQILAGAPADVFASANESNMDALVEADAALDPAAFVTNALQIVVPAGNPADVTALADLGRDELLIGLCAAEVPCGEFGRQSLDAAGVTPTPDTDEPDVRSLLTKVAAGELDAGLVYLTDVIAGGDEVEGIEIPEADNVLATYPIARLADAGDPGPAQSFVDFVLGDDARRIFSTYGFNPA